MKISPEAVKLQENEDLYKRLNKSIEKKIASKEKEIKGIDEIYEKRKITAKFEGEQDFAQSIDRNQQRILAESGVFEEKIQSYRDKLKESQDAVAREEEVLRTSGKAKTEAMKMQMQDNHEESYNAARAIQDQIQSDNKNLVHEIATKTKSDKIALESNAQYEINALSSQLNQKSMDNEKDFRAKIDNDLQMHKIEVDRQKDELKKMMAADGERNKRLADEKNRVATAQLSFQDKHQQNMLVQKDQDFKVRYEQMVKDHDSILKSISTRFEADVKKVVDKTSSDKKLVEDKSADPFYRVEKLNPKMAEDAKDVTVSLAIPEHEKENVILSTQGRQIKLTLTRKYSEMITSNDGSIDKSTRSELFSKEFGTKDILNPREITQTYEDGVLTYKIKKA